MEEKLICLQINLDIWRMHYTEKKNLQIFNNYYYMNVT